MTNKFGKGVKKRRILGDLIINEVSGVDKAAQVPAEALIMKRASEEEIRKYGYEFTNPKLTSSVDGHAHILDDTGQGEETTWTRSEGSEGGHSHPWVRQLDGSIVIGEADGHTHDLLEDPGIQSATKSAGKPSGNGEPMSGETTTKSDAVVALEKSVADLTSRAERAEAISKMSSETRTYFDGMTDDAKETFIAKSATEQATQVADSQAADQVIFKSASGEVYRASDDPRMVDLAKRADAQAEETRVAVEKAERIELSKRADDELGNCPGTVEQRGNILKALTGVDGAEEFLKAANESLSDVFKSQGTKEGTILKAEDQLEVLAKKHAEDNSVTIEKARAAVLETPEGLKLYAELES